MRLALLVLFLAGCSSMPQPIASQRIAEIVASPERSGADRTNDVRRKPAEMLAFIDVQEGWTALDVSAAGGYTTELLARAVGPKGKVYGQTPRPDPRQRLAERMKNPALANIVPVVRPFDNPAPPEAASNALDLVTLMFNYHDFANVDRAAMNRAIFNALKPGGIYVIADHAGRPGTGMSEYYTLHRIEESFLRKELEAAGFQFAGEASFLRHPNDPRDQENPPFPKDEFVLKYRKP
jgi:predicted methyltransferase